MKGAHHGVLTMMVNDDIVRRLVAMSPSAMWHLDLLSEKSMGRRQAVSPWLAIACVHS